MIDLFNAEYVGVMRRALHHYQDHIHSLDLDDMEDDAEEKIDAKNVPVLLSTLDQLPELMKLFQGGT